MATLEWYIEDDKAFNESLVRRAANRGLKNRTLAEAGTIAAKASSRLAPHNASNAANRPAGHKPSFIDYNSGSTVDAFVNLNDPSGKAALAIEGKLNILRGSI